MERRSKLALLLTIATIAALLPALTAAQAPDAGAEVHPHVRQALQATGQAEVLVVLRTQADLSGARTFLTKEAKGRYVFDTLRSVAQQTQRNLQTTLRGQGIDFQSFFIVNAILLRADRAQIESLAKRAEVARIMPNPSIQFLPAAPSQISSAAPDGIELNLLRVNADKVWALGYTGSGVVVAGQDTGYDWDHPALKRQYRGWDGTEVDHDYSWHDAIHSDGSICGADSPEPCDDYGHGTHTMGILVGNDGVSKQIGMAPDAQWIGCRNMDRGVGTPATYLECFEFFLAPYPVQGSTDQGSPALAPDVVNNSWSCPPTEGCDADTLQGAVEALRQAGIVVVASAGNQGSLGCGSISEPPAIYAHLLTVGAFSHYTGQIASFSSRGPVRYAGETYIKPNLVAPGVEIASSLPGGGYGSMSGTSMAAPHVGGAVALLLSAAPEYRGQVGTIEQFLVRTSETRTTELDCGGDDPDDVPNNVWGWGILDAFAVVRSAIAGSYSLQRVYLPQYFQSSFDGYTGE